MSELKKLLPTCPAWTAVQTGWNPAASGFIGYAEGIPYIFVFYYRIKYK